MAHTATWAKATVRNQAQNLPVHSGSMNTQVPPRNLLQPYASYSNSHDIGPPPPNIPKSGSGSSRPGAGGRPRPGSNAGQSPRPTSPIRGEPHPASSPAATAQHRPDDPGHLAGHPISKAPTNKAHPTITSGQESPNVDSDGNPRRSVPEDVRRHNAELGARYDRSYNQIGDEGTIRKGF